MSYPAVDLCTAPRPPASWPPPSRLSVPRRRCCGHSRPRTPGGPSGAA